MTDSIDDLKNGLTAALEKTENMPDLALPACQEIHKLVVDTKTSLIDRTEAMLAILNFIDASYKALVIEKMFQPLYELGKQPNEDFKDWLERTRSETRAE